MIQGEAYSWWESTKIILDAAGEEIAWEVFVREFKNKFIPPSSRTRRLKEFTELKQGDKVVSEYLSEFERLSRYAPNIANDEFHKSMQFMQGLNRDMQNALEAVDTSTWLKATRKALKVEDSVIARRPTFRSGPGSGSGSGSRGSGSGFNPGKRPMVYSTPPPRAQWKKSRPAGPVQKAPPVPALPPPPEKPGCRYCGGPNHTYDNCRRRLGLCLICGAADHRVDTCPDRGYHL